MTLVKQSPGDDWWVSVNIAHCHDEMLTSHWLQGFLKINLCIFFSDNPLAIYIDSFIDSCACYIYVFLINNLHIIVEMKKKINDSICPFLNTK